ncbi:MAG TPA: PSP1 C-terminal domain-containing protein, partial [Promineifilum sp.]
MATVLASGETSDYIGVRFQKLGKLYHFKVGENRELQAGDHVIVETRRGKQLGQVIAFIDPKDVNRQKGMRAVKRKATPRDLVLKQVWESKELDALITCREEAARAGIQDAKFVKAEFSFDGSWLTIAYTTENKKLDVRSVQSALG